MDKRKRSDTDQVVGGEEGEVGEEGGGEGGGEGSDDALTEEGRAVEQSTPATASVGVDCLIKLGGAAITMKDQFETLNHKVMSATIAHLAEALSPR
jgi:hypothetical protein